jgi:phage tail sheath protein FI
METSMNLKLVVVVSLFAAMPTLAYAQKAGPATNAPKPTVAEAQKVVQMISGDKAKLQAYCDLGKVQDQMQQAGEKKDQKTLQALSAQASSLEQKVGPDYVKLMNGLDEVDPNSAEGKRFTAVFDPLDKQCK